MRATEVLAHQGGWDEALLVLVPVGAVVGLVALARRRGRALAARPPTDLREGEGERSGPTTHADPRPGTEPPTTPDRRP